MNNGLRKLTIFCLVALTLVLTLGVGCGKGSQGTKQITITVGNISDMSGPASTALIPINYALDDLARYYNENNLIPGARIKVVSYDGRYDPSLTIPGFDWVKEKGVIAIFTALPGVPETLKPFAEQNKIPILSLTTAEAQIEPPGWVFCMNVPARSEVMTVLKWISENDWDWKTKGPAKIGSAGWEETYASECRDAIKDYAQAHPDEFEYVAGPLSPMGTVMWTGEVQALQGCDYVFPPSTGTGISTFLREFRDKGGTAKLIGTEAHTAYMGLLVDSVGWPLLNGMISAAPGRWWNEPCTVVNLANELLYKYHPKQADDVVHSGVGYLGGFEQFYGFFQIIQKAAENVGIKNLDGQAIYDAAVGFKMTWDGFGEWDLTLTKRYAWNYVAIMEWSAQQQDIVRKVADWLPLVTG
jgi:ABC-type branched-subunit amino acid transport system substrate-binding protein